MDIENLSREELIHKVIELETKLKKKNLRKKRKPTKTTKKQIADYWTKYKYEGDYSFDFLDAEEICWRCGYKKRLQRCHIIPDSLGGKDEPSNFVLLCERCHIDAPNIESETFMWDWLKANKTPFYNTFFQKRALKEYEFIYDKNFFDELRERDIISQRDLELFFNLPIGRSVNHFAHPWKNDSTEAGILRMRIEAFDAKHKEQTKKSESFRLKEKNFEQMVMRLCDIAQEYHFNVWEGRTKNPFSIVLSGFINRQTSLKISIKLGRNGEYLGCYTDEWNPNNMKVKDYDKHLGKDPKKVEDFVKNAIMQFCNQYGKPEEQRYVFTINPIYHIKEEVE